MSECVYGSRCTRCLKKMYRLEVKRYRAMRSEVFGSADFYKNIMMQTRTLQSLLNQHAKVGRAYRRWKRGKKEMRVSDETRG